VFGRALGRIGSFVAGLLCGWLKEAIRLVYTCDCRPVGVSGGFEVNYTWTMADTYIQHRLAALVQVTLGERVSEW
jgi:hypothetical protein